MITERASAPRDPTTAAVEELYRACGLDRPEVRLCDTLDLGAMIAGLPGERFRLDLAVAPLLPFFLVLIALLAAAFVGSPREPRGLLGGVVLAAFAGLLLAVAYGRYRRSLVHFGRPVTQTIALRLRDAAGSGLVHSGGSRERVEQARRVNTTIRQILREAGQPGEEPIVIRELAADLAERFAAGAPPLQRAAGVLARHVLFGLYHARVAFVVPQEGSALAARLTRARAGRVVDVLDEGERQLLLDLYGPGRIARRLGLTPRQEDEAGALFRFGSAERPVLYVRVDDPAKEGDEAMVWLAVPPGVGTATEAVAWSFGLPAARYAPTRQS
jgi:hypothetical protein